MYLVWLALLALLLVLSPAKCRRHSSILYDKLDKMVVPDDRTVTMFVLPGQVIKLFYLLQKDVQTLSLTVTPCSSAVAWEVDFRNTNQTGKVEVDGALSGEKMEETGERRQKHRLISPASKGLYTLKLSAVEESLVEVYATFLGQPSQLWPTGRIVSRPRPAKGHVFIKWTRTTVDPDVTEYVLVVHQNPEEYLTLCRAKQQQQQQSSSNKHFIMEQTGHRTSWLVRGLQINQSYKVEVFAMNVATNFSYRFAEIPKLTYARPKPRPLQDGVQVTADLRQHEPTVLYRYKVRREDVKRLEVGVTACGEASISTEIRKRGSTIEVHKTVKGHAVLTVDKPVFGAVYVIKLKLTPEQTKHVSAQVIAKGNGLEEPLLPEPAEVHEFRGLRGCHEVTLGWVPVEGEATYCLRASQSRRGDILKREPDQCTVDQLLNSLGYSVLQCSRIHSYDRKVVSEKLTNLKPGKQYDIQVSVKKGNSKRLSYKLVRVRTKSRCI